jgi:hypothetical protein
MASPIGAAGVTGLGEQQLKSLIQIWIQEAIRDNGRGGIGVTPGFAGLSATGFAVTTTRTPVCSANIMVPTGFTQAVVHVTCDATANNNTGAADWLYVSATAVSAYGGEAYCAASAGGYGTASASAGQLVGGLVAGTNLVISANVRSGTAWAASGSNIANVNGTCLFLR